jgi:hypothetical protein
VVGTVEVQNNLFIKNSTGCLNVANGNDNNAFTLNQLVMGYRLGGNTQYAHAIKTRHNSGANDNGNAMDFFVWQTTDPVGTVGTKHIMTVGSEGVGIGTTNPTRAVQIYVAGGANEYRISSTAMDVGMGINGTNDFGFVYNRQNFPLVFGTNNVDRMRILGNGFVAVGYTVGNAFNGANCKFTINADYIGGDTGAFCINATDNGGAPNAYNLRLFPYVQAGAQVAYQFKTYNLSIGYDALKILHNGITQFDKSTIVVNGNSSKTLYGPNTTWSAFLEVGAGTDAIAANKAQIISTNGNLHLDCGTGQDMYYGFYANLAGGPPDHFFFGIAMYFNGVFFVSDEREKEDIQSLKTSSSLKRVLAVRPAHYRRKCSEKAPDHVKQERCIGFVAQEVQQSNAHTVKEWNKAVSTEEDPNPNPDIRLGICYNDYVVHLCGAVQEQQKQLETYKEQLGTYKEQLETYKEQIEVLQAREEIWVKHAKEKEQEFADYRALTDKRLEQIVGLVKGLLEDK